MGVLTLSRDVSPTCSNPVAELTGGTALTYAQMADAFAAELDHPVTYIDVPADVTRHNLLGYGLPEGQVEDIVLLFDVFRAGYASAVTTDAAEVLGREPRTRTEFVHDQSTARSLSTRAPDLAAVAILQRLWPETPSHVWVR